MKTLNQNIEQIKALCDENRVQSLFAFGSVINDQFRHDSDIDLVVDIDDQDPLTYADHYFNLKFGLEELFDRQIDLLEQKAIKNPYLKEQIEQNKVLIYGKKGLSNKSIGGKKSQKNIIYKGVFYQIIKK